MSSNVYYAEVLPDPLLRRIVLASGVVLTLAGVPLIVILPIGPLLRIAAVLVWLGAAAREIAGIRRAWNACQRMRFFTDGTVAVCSPGQDWRPGQLVSGGILLGNMGWIRLKVALPDGRKTVLGDLLRGNSRESDDWRRLHVIWRHIGA